MKRFLFGLLIAACCAITQPATAQVSTNDTDAMRPSPGAHGKPVETSLKRAGSTSIDLRQLPPGKIEKRERPEREEPEFNPIELPGSIPEQPMGPVQPSAPAPAPTANFDGLDFANWGAGHPPDTNGDVGPTYYIQTINTSIGVYQKSDGTRVAAFTFNTFMSQGNFGNLCDTDNFGDPVVLYDSFEDRWVITDFAFKLDASGNVLNPPGSFQCFAVSKTGDPVAGGWNFYSINTTGGLGDYPKFGIWPDGLYMSANMFGYAAGASYQGARVYALNKAQMYAGSPTVQIVSFDLGTSDFTLLPSNARLQTGTPPAGSPNYFVSTWQVVNALSVYKFHVDWQSISTSTFTGPDAPLAATSWPAATPANAQTPGNALDVLAIRAMMQNQYTNIGGAESLWATHTVPRGSATSGIAAPRWYQADVTGGVVAPNLLQATTWDPDGSNMFYRFVPSLAVDRAGDMAIGYTKSNATNNPSIMYAGRLAADPVNTFSQTEQLLILGTGTQTGNCGSTCMRWGDYSAMTLDPDGCTFWYTAEYYAVNGLNHLTRIGSFAYPSCTPLGAGGTVSGTVTAAIGGAPLSGATVVLGSRTTTTNASGVYSFAVPSGTYPTLSAAAAGYTTGTATNIVVTDGNTTTKNFSLATTATNACLADTTQGDFQLGIPTNVDLTTSPGDVRLESPNVIDQQNGTVTNSGFGFNSTSWAGQTFSVGSTGQLVQAELDLFCSGCTGTTPNITVSLRATSGATPVPTGADLATATIAGFNSGSGGYFSAVFDSPPTLTAGVTYAIVLRSVSNPSAGTYAFLCSCAGTVDSNPYNNGRFVTSTTSGTSWTADATSGGRDIGFRIYLNHGFAAAGDLVSSLKDANPPAAATPTWSTFSWNTTTPANTALQFQAAGSNSNFGPFNFVGPDGTAATFYTTSGSSLSQFNGKRYLQYRAFLSTTSGAVTPTLNDATVCYADTSGPSADLSIMNSDGVATATPGGSVTYAITASNAGPSNAPGSTVADTFPASLTCSWTCAGSGSGTCTASGSGNINDSVNLPSGGSVAYTATCNISASATGSLLNTATVTAPGGVTDPSSGNNSAADTDTLSPSANLGITNTDGLTTTTPGGSVNYTITASNPGPSNAPGSTVADTFPASLTCSWTCVGAGGGTCTASGSGNINNIVNLPRGGNVTYTASCTVSAGATGSLVNTATVAVSGSVADPTPGNNSATDTDTLSPSANLAITKSDGVTTATAGGSVTYTITASNAGPSNAPGSTVADPFPAALTCSWTCVGAGGGTCTASGSGNINNSVNLPNGGSVTYTASCAIGAGATGSLSNTATVTAAAGVTDPASGNNSATDTDTLSSNANLAITNTDGVTTATPGSSVNYTITASNPGPSNAPGSTVADAFPASLTCSWTCVGASGGTCTASGSGKINDSVGLPNGGSVTYAASCTIAASATGSLSNTATVTAPAGVTDPTPGNNNATDTDTLAASANLAITNTDGVTTATAGGSVNYTITASNPGPSNAPGSTVADTFPASLTCSWTCVGAGSGTCTASGSGNINDTVGLPSGGSVTYTASCTIAASATGSLSNTATVTAPAGVTDPTPGNNSATDADTLSPSAVTFITQPGNGSNIGAGVSIPVVAHVEDPAGAAIAGVQIRLAIETNPGVSSLSVTNNPVTTDINGDAIFSNVSLNRVGNGYKLSATAIGTYATDALSNSFNIVPGPPAKLSFQQQPTNTVATLPIAPAISVSVLDSSGNSVGNSSAAVTIGVAANPGGATLSGTITATAVNGVATYANLKLDKVGLGYTLSAGSVGLAAATSDSFDITYELAFVQQPSDTPSGVNMAPPVTVEVRDASGSKVLTNAFMVQIKTPSAPANIGGTTAAPTINGVASFDKLTFYKVGTFALEASGVELNGATSQPFDVIASSARKLGFVQQPTSTAEGAAITPAVKVEVLDLNANLVSAGTIPITITIGNNPVGASLAGTTAASSTNGVATFGNLSLNKLGNCFSLTASTSAMLTPAESAPFNIRAADYLFANGFDLCL